MPLTKEQIEHISGELIEAERTSKSIVALTERFSDASYEDAYAIQLKTFDTRVKAGAVIVGKKIGLTSKAMQDQFKIREPDYGMITNHMVIREGQPIPVSSLILPRLEPEIAFLLKEDLKGPGINVANVIEATEGVLPAFEVIDSRYKDWKITVKDSISDNASAASMILGGKLTPIKDIDLRLIGLVMEKNGAVVSTAAGAAVLRNPAESVAWLANKLTEYGITLKKGEFVMSGSLVSAVPVEAGASLRATFDRLGSVSVRFE
ncbi:MAG: fumarylacetoacetate hydrolase family protein [Dehalococcoidia bacterium]|jgi:2-oxopent-4-enoate hydratase|nr:fumarylacetoacetate hydrolase family protein [Dehalococcoidia bacterium]